MAYETRKEPKTPLERDMAMIVCRLNTWRTPLTNAKLSRDECQSFKDNDSYLHMLWRSLKVVVDEDHVSWMWNEGRALWDRTAESEIGDQGK